MSAYSSARILVHTQAQIRIPAQTPALKIFLPIPLSPWSHIVSIPPQNMCTICNMFAQTKSSLGYTRDLIIQEEENIGHAVEKRLAIKILGDPEIGQMLASLRGSARQLHPWQLKVSHHH